MNKLKTVYIAHPLRGDVEGNVKRATDICKELAGKGEVIPFSPLHAFNFMDAEGDQTLALRYCFQLLSKVDELWVFGDWEESEGCRMEIVFAMQNKIPIQFMNLGVRYE